MTSIASLCAGQSIPGRIVEVLQNMQKIYGENLVIDRISSSEVELWLRNKTDCEFIAHMMTQKNAIFGTAVPISGAGCLLGPTDFQILCEQLPRTGETGLFLRYLPNIPRRQDYLAGFWFY